MRNVLLALALMTAPAAAQERDLCTDRPGLGTPACTVEPGRVVVETALTDWTLDKSAGQRSDEILFGDTLVRVGVTDSIEAQLGWTPLGYSRTRGGDGVDRTARVGDITLGAKINLASPDGSGFSAAIQPQVTLPAGGAPIGAGDWGARLIVPLSYELSDTVQLQASPELDAAVDDDGDGRHAVYGGTLGVGYGLSDAVTAGLEVQALRDRDPSGHATKVYGGASLAWQTSRNFQLDGGANVGLNGASDDLELYLGVTRRF